MRQVVFAALGVALFAGPAAAEHLYPGGQSPYGYAIDRQYDPRGVVPEPDARAGAPEQYGLAPRARPAPRTGLDRPYGGHGVPYRTPPQGWPNPPF